MKKSPKQNSKSSALKTTKAPKQVNLMVRIRPETKDTLVLLKELSGMSLSKLIEVMVGHYVSNR